MKTTLNQVKIVEYHEGLAKGIAKMWNESRENWGGDSVVTTEQDVKDKEANSTNLHLFIALIGDEVAGYCGLSEYREDEGSLYIPLLNVHPHYHGMKIGKQLVMKAIEKTAELKWPRLDLFTWAGNTKAVPLYKKCGFFWEDREDTVHLMNFIPTVLQIEWLKPFFDKHDWYKTSQRLIEIKPDGLKDKEHTYYEYKWQAGEEFVRIQFERTGRSIRLIETQDFLVEMKLSAFKLLEKQENHVSYHIENRRENPLEISMTGISSSHVKHELNESFLVKKKWTGEFPVTVDMPPSEPSPWKKHPTVSVNLEVDGQSIPLALGLFPKQAGKVHLRTIKKNWRPKSAGVLYLDMESQLEEEASWKIKLPHNKIVEWEKQEIYVNTGVKERKSIPIPVRLLVNGLLSLNLQVAVQREKKEEIAFSPRITLALPGFGAKFGGETDEHWLGFNGPNFVEIEKRNHIVKIGSTRSIQDPITFFTPKFGKPYHEEFSKREACAVEYIELPEAFVIKTTLESFAFPALLLNTYFRIYGDGLVEISHEVVNNGENEKKKLFLAQPVFTNFEGMAIPQKEGVMVGNESQVPFIEYIKDKDMSERWVFTRSTEGETMGLAWPEGSVGRKEDWRLAIEYEIDVISAQEEKCLGPIQVGINTSTNWSRWREMVRDEGAAEMQEIPLYSLEKEGGDVVSSIGEKMRYTFRSMMTPYLHGKLTVEHGNETFVKEVSKEESLTQIDLEIENSDTGIKSLNGYLKSETQQGEVESIQLVHGTGEVMVERDGDLWSVNNGVFVFKASSDYYPGIFSLVCNEKEVFDHQFPEPGPRAWWNPWGGGIRYAFQSVSTYSMLKEQTDIKQVFKLDQYGHQWTGICLTTDFKEHEQMKGVVLRQYALTLPEVPVLAVYAEIEQASGRTYAKEQLDLEAFFKNGETLTSTFVTLPEQGVFQKYYAGIEEFVLRDTPYIMVGSEDQSDFFTFIHSNTRKRSEAYLNKEVLLIASTKEWSAASGETIVIEPSILFYGKVHSPKAIKPLQNIRFN
ncbi:GNAT family N-acetyltransferase (plasmid) [Cytobacillus spongiae]|uniref:GNAT family N-acetyltransferase n=1 Tax=Cytobacillus spongiae TaxID=2901381 RepID=UPI001F47C880|nr:GNAT family N-acetyltransferase [Cytobacillus spongiae]UII58291.1 GNAT family N-acetyltransferase [Cytobacillus spongiae]